MTMEQTVPVSGGADYTENKDLESPALPSEDEARIVSWTKNQFQGMKQDRAQVEKQWYINMCFYRGKQNIAVRSSQNLIQGSSGTLYTPPAPYYRARPVINKVRNVVRREISKLTSQKPTAYILPATSDDEDLFAAKAGEQIWQSKYDSGKLAHVFKRALWWNQVCGNAYVRSVWDADKLDKASNMQGDMDYAAVTPFHLFVPDLTEEDLEDQPFIIYAQMHTDDWVAINFPEAKLAKKQSQESEVLDNAWLDILGAQKAENRKSILCLEVWVKPRKIKMFPNGAMFLVIGESVVHFQEEWPFIHNEYPFAKLSHIPTGKFYTDSSLIDLIPLQREYNRTRGQIIEAKNKTSKPQLMAEKGAVDPSKITSEPGLVIEYQMGYQKPEPLPLQGIPSYVLQELDRIQADMADISGQHEVSKGQVPPGVTAATAINYLQEQDDSILSSTFDSLEEAFRKVAHQTLCYAQQFWDVPRTVKVTGDDEFFDTLMFKGSSLGGNTDIRVESGSALPLSKSAKQAFIMDLMKMGWVDPTTGLEVMEMGGIAKVYESVQIDIRAAQRENLRLAKIDDETFQLLAEQGQEAQIVPVNTWDNHMLHIKAHDKYRKGQAYEKLTDSAKQAFEMHVQMHKLAYSGGVTGDNIMEMMKPEMQSAINPEMLAPPTEEPEGGNQFTVAEEAQATEAQTVQEG